MSDEVGNFTQALGVFRSVAERVPASAWDNQTCCSDWTARQAAGHATWVVMNVTAMLTDGESPQRRPEAEVVGDDPAAPIAEATEVAAAAAAEADLTVVRPTPFGEMPLSGFLGIIWVDTLIHAWDIADAAGIDAQISDELARTARESILPIVDAARDFGGFGPPLDEPDGDEVAALVAFLGRTSVNA